MSSGLTYLGHVVSINGIENYKKTIEAITNWPIPVTVTDVRSFLEFTNYIDSLSLREYAHISMSLNLLTSSENATKMKIW